jgi:hypothetical protein
MGSVGHRLNLVLAHEFLSQLDEHVRDPMLGNTGQSISFRRRVADAELLKKEFSP